MVCQAFGVSAFFKGFLPSLALSITHTDCECKLVVRKCRGLEAIWF